MTTAANENDNMSLTAAALIGAGASLAGGVMSGSQSKSNAKQQYLYNKEMYQNRHQWEVNDLRAAGLNPILSAGGSPPSPTVGQATTPDYSQVGRDAVSAASAASARGVAKEQEKLLKQQQALTYAQANSAAATAQKAMMESQLLGRELKLYADNPELYRDKMLKPPMSREVDSFFDKGKSLGKGLTDYWNNLGNIPSDAFKAFRSHMQAEAREREVRKRYPNMKRD